MKLQFIFTLLLAGLLFTSCGDDDDKCDNLADTLVGTWQCTGCKVGNFEFVSGGELKDPNNVLVPTQDSVTFTNLKWETVTNNKINIDASNEDQTQRGTLILEVTSLDCDKIVVSNNGNSYDLIRQ